MQQTQTSQAGERTQIETHNNHLADEYITDGHLYPSAVNVRLTRSDFPKRNAGYYNVEISALDRDYTFESDVADELGRSGFEIYIAARGGNGTIVRRKNWRAPRGFKKVQEI